jgi:hypothetical protein
MVLFSQRAAVAVVVNIRRREAMVAVAAEAPVNTTLMIPATHLAVLEKKVRVVEAEGGIISIKKQMSQLAAAEVALVAQEQMQPTSVAVTADKESIWTIQAF